jgi:hypothetical protein
VCYEYDDCKIMHIKATLMIHTNLTSYHSCAFSMACKSK